MQNSLNWHYNDQVSPPWYPRHKVLTPVLQCADSIFQQTLCDLVPTTEIENGSLTMDDGKVRYGTQTYDAVVLLGPDSMNAACYAFLQKVDGSRLIVAGEAKEFDDGTPLTAACAGILDRGIRLPDLNCPERIKGILRDWGIPDNRWADGCVLQDGSLIFTAEGEKAVGNPLRVKVCHGDLTVDFEGEDLLFLYRNDGTYMPVYPRGRCLLNGEIS